ncbi:MAG: glycosyltransferase, partial [Cyclobacteriaceae bacterium]
MLKYLQRFQTTCGERHRFHIITFEQESYKMDAAEKEATHQLLSKQDLYWYPMQYHTGGAFMLFKKLVDFVLVYLKARQLNTRFQFETIIGFTTISGALALYLGKILNIKTLLLNIEPHSDYMADFGYWSKKGIKYKVLNYMEKQMMLTADHIAVPTRKAYDVWKDVPKKGQLHFVPTCIDLDDFHFDPDGRLHIRNELGLNDESRLIIYVGKFGGIYYTAEMAGRVFGKIADSNPQTFFYIISPDSKEEIREGFLAGGLKENQFLIKGKVPYEELSSHISAADFGILLVPSYPSQQYRCPIKTANYLACGVPYIITEGIGDDSDLALNKGVGLLVCGDNSLQLIGNFEREKIQRAVRQERNLDLMKDFLI